MTPEKATNVFRTDETIVVPAYHKLDGGGGVLDSTADPVILLEGHPMIGGGVVQNLTINIRRPGARGIVVRECSRVVVRDVFVKYFQNPVMLGGVALTLDGGNRGGHHCTVERFTVALCSTALLVTSAAPGPANCNRHFIADLYAWKCGVGIDLDRGATCRILGPSFESVGRSLRINSFSHRTFVAGMVEENYTERSIVVAGNNGTVVNDCPVNGCLGGFEWR